MGIKPLGFKRGVQPAKHFALSLKLLEFLSVYLESKAPYEKIRLSSVNFLVGLKSWFNSFELRDSSSDPRASKTAVNSQ